MTDPERVVTEARLRRQGAIARGARSPSGTSTTDAVVKTDEREHALDMLGRYEILGRLGRGAMGTVLEAFDPQLDRRVALKLLHDELGPLHTARLLRLSEALANFQRALTILEESLGPNHPRLAYPLNNIGEVLRSQGEQERALGYFQRSLNVLEGSLGSDHPNVASSLVNLGNLLYEQKRHEEAEQHYQRALEIQQRTLPPQHPHEAWPRLGLAKIALEQGRAERAREHAEQALVIREKASVPPVLLAEARFVLARVLWSDRAERSRARSLVEQAREGWSSAGADDPQTKEYLAEVEQWLAEHPER